MKVFWIACLALPLIAATDTGRRAPPKLTVRIYDLADMSPSDLARALGDTSRIFRAAGIALAFTSGDSAAPEAHLLDVSVPAIIVAAPRIVVARIVRNAGQGLPSDALGWALPFAQAGAHITLFLERIKRRQSETNVAVPALLGHALAHELGHVLLRSGEHTGRGLMGAEWGAADFDRMAHGALRFTESQAAAMRATLASLE